MRRPTSGRLTGPADSRRRTTTNIGILGTGMVGRALAAGFVRTGHDVSMGTRDAHETMVRPLDGAPASFAEWLAENPSVALAGFASVAGAAEVVVNATNGSATLMIDPGLLPEPTSAFLSGDDPEAKAVVAGLLGEFGWTDIIDLGDITTARGVEMWLPLWLRIMGAVGGPRFNLRIVR